MSVTTEKELLDARVRFAAVINAERAKLGLPPQAPEAITKPVDPYMERWKQQAAGDQTQAFIQMNAERVARGLRPLGASGVEIGAEVPIVAPTPPPVVPADDFFSTPFGGEKIAKQG